MEYADNVDLHTYWADSGMQGSETVVREVKRDEWRHVGDGVRKLGDFVLCKVKFLAAGQSDSQSHIGDVIPRQ